MSDSYKNPYTSGWQNPYKAKQEDPFSQGTPYEQGLKSYVDQVAKEKAQNSQQIQPVQMLFDILQRGQYVSANMADEIIKAAKNNTPLPQAINNTLTAIWQGITGQRKGSYEDVLRNTLGVGKTKLFKGAAPGSWASQQDWASVLGFMGDVLLDPTTYVGFGPAKAARKAASQFAEDSVKVAIKNLGTSIGQNADKLAELAQKGFKKQFFDELMHKAPEKAAAYLHKFGGDTARYLNGVYNDAFKLGLRTPAETLRNTIKPQLESIVNPASEDAIKNISGQMLDSLDNLGFAQNRLSNLENAYAGAGTRATRFMGKEFFKGERYPTVVRSLDILKKNIAESPVGQTLGNAYWAVMNKGPVGMIRKEFGIRNPYEKVLRITELEKGEAYFRFAVNQNVRQVAKATGGYDDATKQAWVHLNDLAEKMWTKDKPVTAFDLLKDPQTLEQLGIKDTAKVQELGQKVTDLLSAWQTEYHAFASQGIVGESKDIVNYLPAIFKEPVHGFRRSAKEFGSTRPAFVESRSFTRMQSAEQEAAKLRWAFGIDRPQAAQLVNELNMGGIEMNLDNLLSSRAFAQAKVQKRANMVNAFKEFGIPVDEAKTVIGSLKPGLTRTGATIPSLGLSSVADPAFEGMLFDRDVAEIINRAVGSTSPSAINSFQKGLKSFTNWWRGIVTMTTGFHARNFMSNNLTGFMKHGVPWFEPADQMAALAGVAYAVRATDPKKILAQVNISPQVFEQLLNKRYGNFTLRELMDEARKRGVFSEAMYGFDPQGLMEKLNTKTNANPFSREFVGQKASRKVGEYVENHSRVLSFLKDYRDVAGHVDDLAPVATRLSQDAAALDYATREAKKWFIDYTDLTSFEQNTMKAIIPFYTWLRKNIANQIAGVAMYPELYSMFPKIEQFFTYEDPNFDQSLIPDWMKQMGMFPTGKLEDGTYRMFNPNFPFQDLNKIPLMWDQGNILPRLTGQELKDDIVNAMHPAIKMAASAMTQKGYDFFYKQELSKDAPAPYLMRLFMSQPGTLAFLDGFASKLGIKGGIGAHLDENGKLVMDPKMAQTLQQFLPLLRQVDFLFYGANTVVPGLEQAIEARTGAKNQYDRIAEGLQTLSYYAGIKFSPLDLEREKQRLGSDIYWEARSRYDVQRKKLPEVQKRSLAAKQRTQQQQRRLGL